MSVTAYDNLIQNADWHGWLPFETRSKDELEVGDMLVAGMSPFVIQGGEPLPEFKPGDRAVMWKYSKPANNGKHFLPLHQQTGSCVGHGGTNAMWYCGAAEVWRDGDLEAVILPCEHYNYAQSRVCAGMSGRSAGSTGAGMAESAKRFGCLPYNAPGLPPVRITDKEITFSGTVDDEWGRGGAPKEFIDPASKFSVQDVAKCTDAKQAIEALRNYHPLTIASSWGGLMECPVQSGVLLNRKTGTWYHQMSVIGVMYHPDLGILFCILNSWGPDAHGMPPDDAPPGSFWVREKDMAYIIGQGDSFIFSNRVGFPAPPVTHHLGA